MEGLSLRPLEQLPELLLLPRSCPSFVSTGLWLPAQPHPGQHPHAAWGPEWGGGRTWSEHCQVDCYPLRGTFISFRSHMSLWPSDS